MDAGSETQAGSGLAAGTEANLAMFAVGLNAHNQISYNGGVDVRSFIPVTGASAHVLFTGWSSTAFVVGNRLIGLGHQEFVVDLPSHDLIDGFGDHNGLRGCLDTSGKLYLFFADQTKQELVCRSAADDSSPQIGHIALAGNGKVAITFKQAPNGRLCHMLQFDNIDGFIAWFQDPSDVDIDAARQHFMMQGRPAQLIASTATFMVLMERGEVYTWGDPRYQSLGRSIVGDEEGDEAVPAEKPGLVDALSGLKITKIASGGWMSAALSEDNALYIWGTGTPGTEQTIKLLQGDGVGEVVLVEIPEEAGEPLDITDVGMGDNHIAVVVENKRLFVVGDNTDGQLGLSNDQAFFDTWAEVPSNSKASHRVVCGPKATFVNVSRDSTP